MKLTCPIRGSLKVEDKSKDGLNFTEEKRRIELIHFLLNKGYLKSEIQLEHSIKYGNKGRNSLRVDLIVQKEKKCIISAEVKRNSKDKESAIKYQLKPAMQMLKSDYGIYWDGFKNEMLLQNYETFPVHKLPQRGRKFNEENLKLDSLSSILDSKTFYDKLDQLTHNLAIAKEKRYKGLFQIILSKYYDEKFNSDNLQFTSHIEGIHFFRDKLWNKSIEYYKKNMKDDLKIDDKIIFNWKTIKKIIKTIEQISFIKSDAQVLQDFFMSFGPKILKIDLSQFYTPIPIVNFIVNSLNIKNTDFIIDPAGGSADFLTGIIQKYKNNKKYDEIKNNLSYWDNSEDAIQVALLNMILNGDGRTNINHIDSIEEYKKDNGKYNFVITNPPFGQKVIWEGDLDIMDNYELSRNKRQHLGILFIERSMSLLKGNGMLAIILPSGYLNNPSKKYIRDYLINKYKIIADISLPEGSFKGSNTGVKTDILYVQKTEWNNDYKIYTNYAYKLGYDFKSKKLPIIHKLDYKTGEYILDSKNNKIVDTDLDYILRQMKKFAYDENVNKLEKENAKLDYDFILKSNLDSNLKIKPEMNSQKFKNIFNDEELVSLKEIKKSNVNISNSTPNRENLIKNNVIYRYIPIGKASKGLYELDNEMYGWQIKKIGRAQQFAKNNNIYISYLMGSMNKFFLFHDDTKNVIVTNGMKSVYIEDEKVRLSFYKFLFSKNYQIQFEAFATGHIMTNISNEDILSWKFKILNDKEIREFKIVLNYTNKFLNMRRNNQ